jgi:AcrR family transcriptional regulator
MKHAKDSQSGRRARRKAETRERILDAALDLFEHQTYLETTVEQITEAADVGKGTFFNYFPSKEQVLTKACKLLSLGRIQASATVGDSKGISVRETLKQVYLSSVVVPRNNRAIARNTIVAHLVTEASQTEWCENLKQKCQILSDWFEGAKNRGEIRTDRRAEEISLLFVQSLLGAALVWTTQSAGTLSDWLETSFDHFWKGISTLPESGEDSNAPRVGSPPPRHVPDAFPWMK